MWTPENRPKYDRSKLRYPSDLTDEEWSIIGPLIPLAKGGGNKRTIDVRAVLNGVMYILSTGCQWRAIPKDLPPRSTVSHYFCRWQQDGTLDRLHRLAERWRETRGLGPVDVRIDLVAILRPRRGPSVLDHVEGVG